MLDYQALGKGRGASAEWRPSPVTSIQGGQSRVKILSGPATKRGGRQKEASRPSDRAARRSAGGDDRAQPIIMKEAG